MATKCKLSVNINKIATLRNARGGSIPDVIQSARKIQDFGADGITVHPRPDERHITYKDVRELRPVVHTEFNVEGYPSENFLNLVDEVRPDQVTLVPDSPDVITSNAGWDTIAHFTMLQEICARIKESNIRVSIFMDPIRERIIKASELGADRIELYTEAYASQFLQNKKEAVSPYKQAAVWAGEVGLGINAGHDLDKDNLNYFAREVPGLLEVSIGHALISDALYLGLQNTVGLYKRQLSNDG